MELQKRGNNQVIKYQVQSCTKSLINSIQRGDVLEIALNLKQYQEKGIVQFDKLLAVRDRIPDLAKLDIKRLHAIITIMLAEFCNSFNLIRPMTEAQITSCAYEIIISSQEDFISIEDLALFFDGAKKNKYGKILDRMDQQTIFTLFEAYREERHDAYLKLKEEIHANLKCLGPNMRSSDDDKSFKEMCHQENVDYYKKKTSQPPVKE